LNKYEN